MMVLAILTAFGVTVGLTKRFCDPASRLHLLDHPNARSLHAQPTPRSGGVAVLGGLLAGAVVAAFYTNTWELWMLLLCALPVALVSFLDDRGDVSAGVRILAHFLAAGALLSVGYGSDNLGLPGLSWSPPGIIAVLILLLFIVWMTNLYNFMDGMDGFAGGMGMIGFATFAVLGIQADSASFASANLLVATSCTGFILFNFPPAKIFLGDTGSSLLGFLAAAFSLWGGREGMFPLWLALLVFSPFIVDATVTLARRLIRGERVWRPHKTHYYQRLVQLGWGHRRTVLAEYLLMLACSLSALLAAYLPTSVQIIMATLWLVVYTLLILGVGQLERRSVRESHEKTAV